MTTTKQMRVKGTNVRLRQEPSAENTAIAALMQDGVIVHADLTRIINDFIHVQIVNGYIHKKYLVDVVENKIW